VAAWWKGGNVTFRRRHFQWAPGSPTFRTRTFPKDINVADLKDAVDTLLQLIVQFGVAVAGLLSAFELWLRGQLQQMGVPHTLQTVLLIAVAVVLVLGSLRLFGGLIRVVVVLILLAMAIHIFMPVIES
jgi:hypothetical protein